MNGIDGSLSTISKLCEDSYTELDREVYGRPVNYLVPKLITFFGHQQVQIRKSAVHSIVNLLQSSSVAEDNGAGIFNAIIANLEPFLQVCQLDCRREWQPRFARHRAYGVHSASGHLFAGQRPRQRDQKRRLQIFCCAPGLLSKN